MPGVARPVPTGTALRLAAAVALAAGTWAGTAPSAHAQSPDVPLSGIGGSRVTLEEAIRLAETHNPGYRRTTNLLELDAVDEREAWLQLLPRPQLSVLATTMSWNLQRVGTDPFGNPLPNPEARMVQSSQSSQRASLFFSFNFADYMRFRNRGDAAITRRVNAVHELHELHVDVWRTFLDAQQRQGIVALEEELLERQRLNREVAGRLYALAQQERIDLLEADLDVAVQEEQVRQSRAELSTALLALRSVIGDPALPLEEVEPVPFRTVDPAGLDDEGLVREALASSPAIALQEAELHAQEQALTTTRWQQWLPSLSFQLTTGRTELERDGGGAFFQPNPTSGWDRMISIGISLPDLGRRFENQVAMDRQQAGLRNAGETLRERRIQVEQSVRATLVDLRAAHASVALQEQRVALAEERHAGRLESYRLGRGSYPDLQAATDAVAAAERALLNARYQLERAIITLEQRLGLPLESISRLGGS